MNAKITGYLKIVPAMKHWIAVILINLPGLISNSLFSQQSVELTVPETINAFTGEWCCANDGYIYGLGPNQRTQVYRKRENGQAYELRGSVTALDPSYKIENRLYSSSVPGLIFALVKNDNSNFFLLKSSDGGLTFTKVFTFGEGNGPGGTDTQNVRMLRGILELTTDVPGGDRTGALFIGEYNINQFRTPGGTNDRVRIMRSTDHGDTWTKVMEWNSNGSNQVGHIHAMKQDPYTGEIYVCIGDYNSRMGIVKWDGVSQWTDNRTLSQVGAQPGFRVLSGMQRYRTCDVLFDENYFYTFTDTQYPNNQNGTESGIWRGRKNFSSFTRVDNQIFSYDPMHIGWFGEKIGNTFIFTTSKEYLSPGACWKQLNTQVYVSTDGSNWYRTGLLGWRSTDDLTTSRYITNVFSYNNNLYLDMTAAAGHASTIQCSISGKWKTSEDPVILHPVFFVGNWNNNGNDNYPGTNPDFPKRTLNNTLSNNAISAGSRVRISSGEFNEPAINPLWSNAYFPGRGSVVIEGEGIDKTFISRTGGNSGNYCMLVDSTRTMTNASTPLIIKNLSIANTVDGGTEHTNYVLYSRNSFIRTVNCRIGNVSNDDSPLIFLEQPGSKYESESSIHIAPVMQSPNKLIVSAGALTYLHFKNCVIQNAYNAFILDNPGIDFSLRNCTLYGIENGITIGMNNNTQPLIENNIFTCAGYPINDQSSLTESMVDYNCYNRANYNVNDGGHGPATGTDPGFIDPANGDFRLKSGSACSLKGILMPDVKEDITGRIRSDPPSLGAYENIALLVSVNSVTLNSASGSTAGFLISSNTAWGISETGTWITLSTSAGNGTHSISITANSSNDSKSPRSTRLGIGAEGTDSVFVQVTQSSDVITSDPLTEKSHIVAYPNPVSGILRVEYNDYKFTEVIIMNTQGIILKKQEIKEKTGSIDFSGFRNGIYILEFVGSDNRNVRIKLIKNQP